MDNQATQKKMDGIVSGNRRGAFSHLPVKEFRHRSESLIDEILSRNAPPYVKHALENQPQIGDTLDYTRPNYAWWSYFRRGLQRGYELSSGLALPILRIMSAWTLGERPTIDSGTEEIDRLFNEFLNKNYDRITTWFMDAVGLGDSYLIVNPDLSLSPAPPDEVYIRMAQMSLSKVEAFIVQSRFEDITVIDEYQDFFRQVTIRSEAGEQSTLYENPLGIAPIVQLSWGRESTEVYGHPVYAPLYAHFQRYHDILNKSLDGIELMGNPLLVAEGMEDADEARQMNATGVVKIEDKDGNIHDDYVIDVDSRDMWWLGKGGVMKFVTPGSFAGDSRTMAKLLWLIIIEHCNIPEWAWGGAISSSKASVDAQAPAFIKTVTYWRDFVEKPLLQLFYIYYLTLTNGVYDPDAIYDWQVEWPVVLEEDAEIQLKKVQHADVIKAVTREEQLRILDIVKDPERAIKEADKEAEEMQDRADIAIEQDLMQNPLTTRGGGEF